MLSGCTKNNRLTYDKSNPQPIEIVFDFSATNIKIMKDELLIKEDLPMTETNTIFFPIDYFMTFYPDNYQILIENETNQLLYSLSVINFTPLEIITKDDLFNIGEINYYVLFTQNDCAPCESVLPDAIKIYNHTLMEPNSFSKIYQLRMDDPYNFSLKGERNIENVTSIEELRINSTPTLILISNNVIIDYYTGSYYVGEYFGQLLAE